MAYVNRPSSAGTARKTTVLTMEKLSVDSPNLRFYNRTFQKLYKCHIAKEAHAAAQAKKEAAKALGNSRSKYHEAELDFK